MKKKIILSTLLTIVMTSSISFVANAKVTDAVITDKSGNYYKYDYNALADSLIGDGVLFDSFISRINGGGKLTAYLDDKVGFVRSDDVANAVVLDGQDFQSFIDSASGSIIITIDNPIKRTVLVNNEAVDEESVTVTLDVDNTSLIGYTFLKINFDGADPENYTVTYDGQEATWSEKFNTFVVKFDGTRSISEFSKDKVIVSSKTEVDFDVSSIE